MKPAVGPLAACRDESLEAGHAIIQFYATQEPLQRSIIDGTQYADRIFTFDFARRVHEAVGQLAIVGDEEQTLGVDIEPADGDPAATGGPGQLGEDDRSTFRITTGDDLTDWFMVEQHPRGFGLVAIQIHDATINDQPIAGLVAIPQLGIAAIQ